MDYPFKVTELAVFLDKKSTPGYLVIVGTCGSETKVILRVERNGCSGDDLQTLKDELKKFVKVAEAKSLEELKAC